MSVSITRVTGLAVVVILVSIGFGCSSSKPVVETGPTLAELETFDPTPYTDSEPVFEGDVRHDIPVDVLDRSLQSDVKDQGTRHVPGFRIQVASFRDRTAANRAYQQALGWARSVADSEDLPAVSHEVYLDWDQPYWKVRVGDFETRGSASQFIDDVRKTFEGAFIVPTTVTLQ